MNIRFTDLSNQPGNDSDQPPSVVHTPPSPEDEDGLGLSAPVPEHARQAITAVAEEAKLITSNGATPEGVVGWTMYDLPSSEDGTVTVLLPADEIHAVPSQALVRIKSPDSHTYLGIVVAGPFAEPDGLRADAHLIVTTTVRSKPFQPRYHGRVHAEILGEEINGILQPPRFRPLPNSAVSVLSDEETARVLSVSGEIRLGLAVGHQGVAVGLPAKSKAVLPRHTGIIGTTGGGKSTTVAGFVAQAQKQNFAVILLDVEGEYTRLHEQTTDNTMIRLLERQGRRPEGIPNTRLYTLAGRETTNESHPNRKAFTLKFSSLSPFTVVETLEMTEAQAERYFQAYEIAKQLAERHQWAERELGNQRFVPEDIDEFEEGYPGITLDVMLDLVILCASIADKTTPPPARTPQVRAVQQEAQQAISEMKPTSAISWKALRGRLMRLKRMKAFDVTSRDAEYLNPAEFLTPGTVNIVDLSDTDGTDLRNVVIADLLRTIQRAQESAYTHFEQAARGGANGAEPPRTLVIIEEAHEFLAKNRAAEMPNLFQQVERIAKRGRKRWLGLVFVTQLPQHLAPQVFALINNWIIHKVSDPVALSELRQAVSGIDGSLWQKIPGLAPGQAVVAATHMTRPVLTAIDPAAARLRMVD